MSEYVLTYAVESDESDVFIYDAKISEFLNVESEFRRNLVKLLEMFMRKADNDYKRRTRDVENIRGVKKNSIFYTRQQIMDYKLPKMDNIDNNEIYLKIVSLGQSGINAMTNVIADTHAVCFGKYCINVTINDKVFDFVLWDTKLIGFDENTSKIAFSEPNLFILSYNCEDELTFMNMIKRVHEVRDHHPKTPIILVGTKIDLREDDILRKQFMIRNETKPIGYEQGEMMARKMGCLTFIETSSKNLIEVNDFLEFIVKCCVVSVDENYATQIGLKRDKKNCELQ